MVNYNQFCFLREVIENKIELEKNDSYTEEFIQDCIKKDLISIVDKKIFATDKTYGLMESYKVDNAIILAAGYGSRFVPYTYFQPKGLVEVNGEILIERQITQMLSAGITNIILVVGYMKETFNYLVDKYGVTLIDNNDYSQINNISSLYYCNLENELKNSYVTTSDIIISDNVYHQYEYRSWYATKYFEEETLEWGVKSDENDRIIRIDRSSQEQYVMYGPAYFNLEFSKKIAKEIDAIYGNEAYNDSYWEDIVIENLNNFEMYTNHFAGEAVIEFESYEELREYDKSYFSESRNPVMDIICDVFNCELKDIHDVLPVKAGMTNDSFRFSIGDAKYVFRIAGEGTELLIDRYAEEQSYKAIHHLNISDDIIYLDPSQGIKITKFIEGGEEFTYDDRVEIVKTVQLLHNSGITVNHEFDINERLDYYHQLCVDNDAITYDGLAEYYRNISEVQKYVDNYGVARVFCHLDPVIVNFLKTKEKTYLLDWEYSAMSHPFMDLGMNVLYSELNKEQADELLELYLNRKPEVSEYKLYYAYIILIGILWTFWTQYKESLGELFGTYGKDQFAISRTFYDEFYKL